MEGATSLRGRKSVYAGKHLFPKAAGNTRRCGTKGFDSLQIILDSPGITYEEFRTRGGRSNDLAKDVENGNVEARSLRDDVVC